MLLGEFDSQQRHYFTGKIDIYCTLFKHNYVSIAISFQYRDFRNKIPHTSVIRQKDESRNGCCKKREHAKFSEKGTFLTPMTWSRTCAYQRVKNVRFLETLGGFAFLNTRLEIGSFALLPMNNDY